MKKSGKTAGSFRVPDQHTTTKRAWFPRGDGAGARDTFDTFCDKRSLAPCRLFNSWNANEGTIGLALGRNDEVLLFDGNGRPFRFSANEAMQFLADMVSESESGDHWHYGERAFYEAIAAALKGGRS